MDDKMFAIVIALIANAFAIFIAFVTSKFAERRETRTFSRDVRKDKVAKLRLLYEDAIFALSNLVIQKGVGTIEQRIEFTRLEARLELFSTMDIRKKFNETFEIGREMSGYARSAEPRRLDDKTILIESKLSSKAEEYEKKVDELYPAYQESFITLKNLIIKHLEGLEELC